MEKDVEAVPRNRANAAEWEGMDCLGNSGRVENAKTMNGESCVVDGKRRRGSERTRREMRGCDWRDGGVRRSEVKQKRSIKSRGERQRGGGVWGPDDERCRAEGVGRGRLQLARLGSRLPSATWHCHCKITPSHRAAIGLHESMLSSRTFIMQTVVW